MTEKLIQPIEPPDMLKTIAEAGGGTINECNVLPDGSGFATMSFPLPKDHWIYANDGTYDAPPMTLRDAWIHADGPYRETMRRALAEKIREGGRYAVRSATMKGTEMDFDPDALIQNLVVGLLGYWTEDGLSGDAWANPEHLRSESAKSVDAVDPAAPTVTD
jgi:hypothetical protein